jgi:hypothetical protein
VFELSRISIPLKSVGLRLQIHRYSISLRRFIFTYDLVVFPWLIWEIRQGEEGLTFKRSGSSYRFSPGGQSAQAWRTVREEPHSPSVLRKFLCVFRSIHFVGVFLLHEVRERSSRTVRGGADGPRAIADGPLLRVRYGGSRVIFGRSAAAPRTVRLGHANGSPGACGRSAWSYAEFLSPLLLKSHFRFAIVCGLLLGLVGLL